jgi:drug/metabolite transporter (DMT)-like permease
MKNTTKVNILAKMALFSAALIWGSSFIVVKSSTTILTPNFLLGFRFTIAFFVLSAVFRKKLKLIDKSYLREGFIIGLCIYAAYYLHTIGIITTTPGKNAFLTAIYCVIVPFLYWIVDKSKPDIYNFTSAILCIAGIGFVSLTESLSITFGDTVTLLSGFFYAAHMVFISKFGKGKDPILLTIIQFGYCALFSWSSAFLFEPLPIMNIWNINLIGEILYLSVFATAIALLLQNIGQKHTHPSTAAIILSLESVFGVLFSVFIYGEDLNVRLVIGFLLIFFAIITSETKPSLNKNVIFRKRDGYI